MNEWRDLLEKPIGPMSFSAVLPSIVSSTFFLFAPILISIASAASPVPIASNLTSPVHLALDGENLYFSEQSPAVLSSNNLKKISKEGGPVTTLADNAALYEGQYRGIDKIAFNNLNVYAGYGGYGGYQIIGVPKTGGTKTILASTTGGSFLGVIGSDAHELYYGSAYYSIVKLSLEDGSRTTVVSGKWPRSSATDDRHLYFVDYGSKDLLQYDVQTGDFNSLISSNYPYEGHVFLDDVNAYLSVDGVIKKVSKNGGNVQIIVNSGLAFGYLSDNQFVYYLENGDLKRMPVSGGTSETVVPSISITPERQYALAADNRYLYWTDAQSGQIFKYPKNPNQPPILFSLNQYKSDSTTQIPESGITQEQTVVFKAVLSDQDSDQVKLQVELKEKDQAFNEQNLIESSFVVSGNEVVITRYGLVPASYYWRARAVDSRGGASEWQEFGTAGNVDFEVKLVPLYTQVRSPYPSDPETDEWDDLDYAKGIAGNYFCGSKIYQCGCALTSAVMVSRYYGITNINNEDVNPRTLNDWLNTQPKGYSSGGGVDWLAVAKYSNYQVKYDIKKSGDYLNNYAILNEYLDKNQPAIVKEKSGRGGINREHFIVIDNKLATTYGVKDPAWYNTTKLNETTDSANKVRGYDNGFDGLRLFYPGNGIADSAISLNLASPAEFLVTDPIGRRFGKDPSTNTEYNEIPDASYFAEGIDDPTGEISPSDHENKTLYIENPLDGHYDIKVIGTGQGEYTVDSAIYDAQGQVHAVTFTGNTNTNITASYNLNYDSQQPQDIVIAPQDTEAPVISYTQLNSEYIVNSASIIFNFSAQDIGTGVYGISATLDGNPIADGQVVSFAQLGNYEIKITAEDYVGNKRTETIIYKVIYGFGGFLPPIRADGSGIYKLGRILPIKFQLTDANNNYISTAIAHLFVAKISDGIAGIDEVPLSTSNADVGNVFRYDADNNQYIYNLSTNILSVGSWQLKIILDDSKEYIVVISIK